MRRAWLFLVIAFMAVPRGLAQNAGPIATDRPAITDSSSVVPKGMLQVENGVLDTADDGRSTLDFPETLIRFGLSSVTELRLTLPDYYDSYHGSLDPSGPGDLSIGLKRQLGTPGGFQVSAVLSLSLPTGAHAISSHGYDPSIQFPWSRPISANWTVAGMLSVDVPTQNGSHTAIGESTFLFDRQWTKAWDAFIEYAGDFPQAGGPRHLLHFGTAYKLGARQQIDFHVGVGLSAAAVDHFVGAGYSFRFKIAGR